MVVAVGSLLNEHGLLDVLGHRVQVDLALIDRLLRYDGRVVVERQLLLHGDLVGREHLGLARVLSYRDSGGEVDCVVLVVGLQHDRIESIHATHEFNYEVVEVFWISLQVVLYYKYEVLLSKLIKLNVKSQSLCFVLDVGVLEPLLQDGHNIKLEALV